jgi:de-etiolated-1
VKRALALLPFNCQSLSPSAYFDQSIFHYDEKLISAAERHKPCMEHPIKFISRKKTNALRFKIQPGPEGGSGDGRAKRVASYVFHPILPFAISIQQTYMQPPVINFHFRWPV